MLTVVGAFKSTLMLALGQRVGLVETGVPHWRPVIVTAYGLGLANVTKTAPAGPPGYTWKKGLVGVNPCAVRPFATVAAPDAEPAPKALQAAPAMTAVATIAPRAPATPNQILFRSIISLLIFVIDSCESL